MSNREMVEREARFAEWMNLLREAKEAHCFCFARIQDNWDEEKTPEALGVLSSSLAELAEAERTMLSVTYALKTGQSISEDPPDEEVPVHEPA